jgi:hypothetical protein
MIHGRIHGRPPLLLQLQAPVKPSPPLRSVPDHRNDGEREDKLGNAETEHGPLLGANRRPVKAAMAVDKFRMFPECSYVPLR